MIRFLLNIQDQINFDLTVKCLIDNELHEKMMDELFDQRDRETKELNNGKVNPKDEEQCHRDCVTSSPELFTFDIRCQILVALIN